MSNPQSTKHDGSWHTPIEEMTISPNTVHIWKVKLTPQENQLSALQNLLSPDERHRAQRMKFQQHRNAFIAAHSALRLLLGRYLNVAASSIKFCQEAQGKPSLLMPSPTPHLLFNLSHSPHCALYAFALEREVGIDLEYKHRTMNCQSLIERVCSEQEKAVIAKLEPDEQQQIFLACWTRKEAYLKATGKGISFPLHAITVSLSPTAPASLLKVETDAQEPQRWAMQEILVDADHVGALVVEGHNWNSVYWEWSWNTVSL